MSRVILIGSGATRGTLGEIAPVAKDFGKHLNENVPDWREKYPYLAAVVRFLKPQTPDTTEKPWALDKVWSAIDNRVKLRYILGLSLPGAPFPPPYKKKNFYKTSDGPWGFAGRELLCVVARVYGDGLDIQKAAERNGTLKKELALLQSGDCVISFNYDLLAEKIMEKLDKTVIRANPWLEPMCASNAILLCKPHGCLSWKRWVPEKWRDVEILGNPMEEDEIDFYPKQDVNIQPGIAAPVPFKSEIIFPELQLQSGNVPNVPNFFRLLVAQWKCAIQRISKTEKLVIMGYGFPPEDLHAHYLFAEAAAKRKNKKLEVEVFEKCEQRFKDVSKEIYELFKSESCEYKGEVK